MEKFDHLVVLMLENRSFDNVFATLYPKSAAFDGLDGTESNPWHKPDGTVASVPVWSDTGMPPEDALMPDPDPGELFHDMTMQIFGLDGDPRAPATMSGFVDNYMRQPPADRPYDPRQVMHHFTAEQLPVMSQLAQAFGVSDRWFASAPCETWPNRFFAHCGTSGGWVNNGREGFPHRYPRLLPTIFRRLGRHRKSWKIYFHDVPQAAALVELWPSIPTRFRLFEDFLADCAAGTLPSYSFIEPRYYPDLSLQSPPNDMHPPHNVVPGEQLVADTYNSLRQGPRWERTLFVITFDEHGGCYDHVPPPRAVPPGPPYSAGFSFDRYGVRVPTVVISPYVPAGSIIRPPAPRPGEPATPFDHTSLIATLQRRFGLGPPMTPRVASAPDLAAALSLERPDNPGPQQIEASRAERDDQRKLARQRFNHHQETLRHPAMRLPTLLAQGAGHAHLAARRAGRR